MKAEKCRDQLAPGEASPSGDKERNSWAASSEENTGNTSSPESKKKWGSSKPLLSCPTIG
jgi:hypothetical protein